MKFNTRLRCSRRGVAFNTSSLRFGIKLLWREGGSLWWRSVSRVFCHLTEILYCSQIDVYHEYEMSVHLLGLKCGLTL